MYVRGIIDIGARLQQNAKRGAWQRRRVRAPTQHPVKHLAVLFIAPYLSVRFRLGHAGGPTKRSTTVAVRVPAGDGAITL
jgi:hypothetical protein